MSPDGGRSVQGTRRLKRRNRSTHYLRLNDPLPSTGVPEVRTYYAGCTFGYASRRATVRHGTVRLRRTPPRSERAWFHANLADMLAEGRLDLNVELPARTTPGYAPPVIVVVGQPAYRPPGPGARDAAVGLAAGIARAAASDGSTVQLVGKIGADPAGDALVLAMTLDGIGHAAVLRDPARPTPLVAESDPEDPADEISLAESPAAAPSPNVAGLVPADPALRPALESADIQLALAYLNGIKVVVVADPLAPEAMEVVAEAARFNGADLIVLGAAGGEIPIGPDAGTVLEAPADDPGEVFAGLVGRYAAGLDRGTHAREAFDTALAAAGWEPTRD
jgi:hypothetical protein